jgi:hypothetical protein
MFTNVIYFNFSLLISFLLKYKFSLHRSYTLTQRCLMPRNVAHDGEVKLDDDITGLQINLYVNSIQRNMTI